MEESSTQTEDREYLLNKKIEALEGVKKVQAERIKELKMELHAYKQSSNVPNGVPLGDTIGKVRELEMSGLAMDELDHSPLHLELEQLSIQGGEDNEDGHGPNRAQDTDNFKQENSSTLPRFRREYYCPTSCVSRVISFIFDQMRLPVCNTRLHKEVQKDLCSLSKFPDVDCEVGECSLAFKDFHDVGLIEKQHMFLAKIENAEERGRRLKEAIDTMEGESHPALFIMHYELYQDGKKRDGHSLAIMPNGEFIQVKEKRQWKPEQDQLWKSVTQIEVWKVEKKTAEDWEKKCGWKKCTRACIYSRNRKEKHT
ncbi:Hypothetical predicted protein [Paramuricea clavata]|uniref:Uncharacterized protein n=1 Tax=Paramuricea clavata TaxID=317549 RepID=A0A6S7J9E9_PARCT|nr:Hypothetical predicted protein [Paramuricea clavata]